MNIRVCSLPVINMRSYFSLLVLMIGIVASLSCSNEGDFLITTNKDDLPENSELSIAEYNKDKEDIIIGSRMLAGEYGKNTTEAFLTFLIVTDIHGNYGERNFHALERALDYAKEKDYVETVLCLGDIGDHSGCLLNYDWARVVGECGKPVLAVPGNHEFVYHTGQREYNGFTDELIFQKLYTESLQKQNGEIHGGKNQEKNYWYKDIEKKGHDNLIRKIRVIGLYQYELSEPDEDGNSVSRYKSSGLYKQEQIEWLIDLLDSVDENTYVLIITHSPVIGSSPIFIDNPFSPRLYGWPKDPYQMVESNRDFIAQIVNAWVTGVNGTFDNKFAYGDAISVTTNFQTAHKNQFICFLSGHAHTDFIVKHRDFDLYQVMLNCTALDQEQQLSDIPRLYCGKTMDCVTLLTYDWFYHQIRLIRLGSDVTIDMRERKYTSINL